MGVCENKGTILLFVVTILGGLSVSRPAFAQEKGASFGYDLFKPGGETISEGPVDDQYILSPGDEVVVSTWGQLNLLYNLAVSPEGFIEIPDEGGRVQTNGVSLKELRAKVTQALSLIHASYINAESPSNSTAFVDVRLGKIRKLLLYVVGEVQKPGAYTLSSGVATVVNLLNNAGGVKESGSLREIRVRRADGLIDTVDLYDFLLTGKLDSKKNQLLTGDYVIVPLKKKSVGVNGQVRRPMSYELIGGEGLKELVSFAGGFLPDAYLLRSQLKRFETNRGEVFIDIDIDELYKDPKKNYALVDRDTLTVSSNIQVRKNMVVVSGDGITRAGTFEFHAGMTIRDLIAEAGGLREHVYLDRADLVRTEADFSKTLRSFPLRELYKEVKPGVYQFTGDAEKNFTLNEMDQVSIYSSFGMSGQDKHVSVEGRVKEPGTFVMTKGMTVYDLVFMKGGFQDPNFRRSAFLELSHVIRKVPGALGTRLIPFNLGKVIDGDSGANFPLMDEDVVRVYSNEQMKVKAEVEIEGLVNKPGTYGLTEGLCLEDLVVLAGGLSADAYKTEAMVTRTEIDTAASSEGGKREAVLQIPIDKNYTSLPQEKKTTMKAFDKVFIRNLPGWEPLMTASLRGKVQLSGIYSIDVGKERISSLIQRAGGLKPGGFPEGATLRRLTKVVEMQAAKGVQTVDVTVDLAEAIKNPGGPNDILLEGGDAIFVPANPGTVEVRGAVKQPLIIQHQEGYTILDYLGLCGGSLKDADSENITVLNPNKTTLRAPRGRMAKTAGGRQSKTDVGLLPGSVIEVPFRDEKRAIETVTVSGSVAKAAVLQYVKGARLGYYINLCGGLTQDADLDKAVVHCTDGGLLIKKPGEPFNPAIPPGSTVVWMAKEQAQVQVRPVAASIEDPAKAAADASPPKGQIRRDTVEVRGAVVKPAVIPHVEGAKLEYYLNFCGGFAEDADVEAVTVQLPDGTVAVKQKGTPFNPVIRPGTLIEIKKKETQSGK